MIPNPHQSISTSTRCFSTACACTKTATPPEFSLLSLHSRATHGRDNPANIAATVPSRLLCRKSKCCSAVLPSRIRATCTLELAFFHDMPHNSSTCNDPQKVPHARVPCPLGPRQRQLSQPPTRPARASLRTCLRWFPVLPACNCISLPAQGPTSLEHAGQRHQTGIVKLVV